jgi:DnaJ-class molecular chaperone
VSACRSNCLLDPMVSTAAVRACVWPLQVPLREVVHPGYERIVKGEGMPISKAPGSKGNLRIKFNVQFPSKQLNEEERRQLETLLAGKY